MPLNTNFTQQQIQLNYLEDMAFELQQNHPILLNYNFKLRQLDIERRLKLENLKPTLNAKYNLLSEQFNFQSQAGILLSNNYYFGLNFSMPLTFMEGRGALRLTKLEIQNTRYEMNYKNRSCLINCEVPSMNSLQHNNNLNCMSKVCKVSKIYLKEKQFV